MRVDAHQHYWRIERGDYGWIPPDNSILYRDYLPNDLRPQLTKHRMLGTVLVQAASTPEETAFMLELAEKDETVLGVVGYLDLLDERHAEHFARFVRHPKYVGFRLNIQDMRDPAAILRPECVEALQGYAAQGVPIDLLVTSGQLGVLAELIRRVPGLHGVIDHLAKPRIAEGLWEPWADYMRELAEYPDLYCKVSGMVTEADHDDWRPEQLAPYIRHVLDLFGVDRVMFGSDWPVCLLAASYDEVIGALESGLPAEWGEAERAKLFGLNAKKFYRL